MSVTFWIPDAPKSLVPCEWCALARKERPFQVALDQKWADADALTEEEWSRVTCDPWCPGEHAESTEPEANFANVNAVALLALVGLPTEGYGKVAHADIPAVLRAIMRVANRDDAREALVREPSVEFAHEPMVVDDPETGLPTITRGCRVIDCGNTDEQTMGRLLRLRAVLVAASEGGFDVHWG
jgi:hypothetical protein